MNPKQKPHSWKWNEWNALNLSFSDIKTDSLCQVLLVDGIQCDQIIPIKGFLSDIQ